MNTVLAALAILVIIVLFGYWAYSTNQYNVKPIVQQYVPSEIQQRFSTGDIMSLNLQPMTNAKSVSYGNVNSNTIVSSNNPNSTNSKPVPVNATQPSILNASAEASYGQTSQFKQVLPTGTFQLGNGICICGTIQMVVPNSCVNLNGQVTCQYVQPPIWHFLISFTCKIAENNNCAMDDHSTYGVTDGSGNYNYTWIPTQDLNPGYYLISIQASSQTKDPSGSQYTLTQQEMVNLVR